MAHKKPENINVNSDELTIINALSIEEINDYFSELQKCKTFNPFFGALVFRQVFFAQVERLIKDSCTACFYGLYTDLVGTCEGLRPLARIIENIGNENYPLAVTDISIHALIMWDLDPIETPVLDIVKADFISLLYAELNAETLNDFNCKLFYAKNISRLMLNQLKNEQLPPNVKLVLEKYLKLI